MLPRRPMAAHRAMAQPAAAKRGNANNIKQWKPVLGHRRSTGNAQDNSSTATAMLVATAEMVFESGNHGVATALHSEMAMAMRSELLSVRAGRKAKSRTSGAELPFRGEGSAVRGR